MSGSVDWEDDPLYYLRLSCDGTATVQVDGIAFNNGYVWTYPYGELIHTETENISTRGGDAGVLSFGREIRVTYAFNPILAAKNRDGTYELNIQSATARLAGAFIWDHLAGYVLADSKTRLTGDTLEPVPKRDVMLQTKRRLIKEAKQDVAEYGYGYVGGVV